MKRNWPRALVGLSAIALLASCSAAPPCTYEGKSDVAVSAGCLVLNRHHALLVVEDFNGNIASPGGSTNSGESAQCAAQRETWEETGLNTRPVALVKVFDNGFHLYHCELDDPQAAIDPPMRMEIQRAFWLAAEDFTEHPWRFPGQQQLLARWIDQAQTTKP